MRNALAHAGKSSRRVVAALMGTAFAQDTADAARAQWRKIADQLRRTLLRLGRFMDEAETDVLAYMSFPPPSTGPRSTRRMRWRSPVSMASRFRVRATLATSSEFPSDCVTGLASASRTRC